MTKTVLRCFASSSLNPFCKTKPISVRNGGLGAVSAYFSSTGTDTTTEPSSLPYSVHENTLFRRLMGATDTRNPNRKEASQVLKQWADEGREIDSQIVRNSIKQLRTWRRYDDALEVSEWFGNNSKFTSGSAAIHLDLIYKVHGLEQAERYFEITPNDLKAAHLYGALLNCYVQEKLLDKAEAIMQKMRELGYAENLSYNHMLDLYAQMGKRIKLISLVQEMEKKGMHFDNFTYNILLNAYASTRDVTGMEKLLMKMEADSLVVMDWIPYSISANVYLKAGEIAKAANMLKKCEHKIKDGERRGLRPREVGHAYEVIMTQYASMGNKDEVYHIWKLHKKPKKWLNRSYICMISSLLKLDDTAGAEKLLDEWFSENVLFDIQIPNIVLAAVCKKGLMEEAESIVNNILERGEEPNASTWHYMALGYWKINQMEDAVKMTKKGLCTNPRSRPGMTLVASCLDYLKKKGDNDEFEEILGFLKGGGKFPADFCDFFSRYLEKRDPSVLLQMKKVSDEEEMLDCTDEVRK
ncbi:OLC1v1023989C1 [Oldenlandia corymbosa var. corymbosa]|uniref:OLC1v1023989C1 n=1 Tax=Oldenlandia corymbosa var. corymbosa TaxID=529605 RepID=A0AAV1C4S3_OLDCO|nr:OLC1v1023989C1 [Oldenlandia corymbosa var. corymbosa]